MLVLYKNLWFDPLQRWQVLLHRSQVNRVWILLIDIAAEYYTQFSNIPIIFKLDPDYRNDHAVMLCASQSLNRAAPLQYIFTRLGPILSKQKMLTWQVLLQIWALRLAISSHVNNGNQSEFGDFGDVYAHSANLVLGLFPHLSCKNCFNLS